MPFVRIECGMTAYNLVQIEERDFFFDWNFFPIVFWRPTEQAKIIADRLRQKASLNIIVYARALIALAHFRAVPIKDKGDVRVMRWFDAKSTKKLDVFRCVGKMIFAANDVRNLHLHVVDHVDEMKDPGAVRTANGHVGMGLLVRKIEIDFAGNEIVDDHMFAW